MKSRAIALIVVALPVIALACLGQPERTFLNDLFDASTDATTQPVKDAAAVTSDDGPAESATTSGDGQGEERMEDAGPPEDAAPEMTDGAGDEMPDAALDTGVDTGCGPIDTTAQCGACQNACDTAHSAPTSCAGTGDASTCVYSGCSTGFADCVPAAPNTNGCETPITTPSNCNGCGIACETTHSVGAACTGTGCTYSGCATGFKDCDAGAPNTNGCETAITTPSNCTGCGIACGTANVDASTCGASGCQYTCQPGFANCNTAAPNTAGCTCATPGCCGTGCNITHGNGVGDSYYDCNALKTFNYTTAHEACAAYTHDSTPANCMTFGCTGYPATYAVICSNPIGGVATACVCWEYSGGQIGKFDTSCECPAAFDGTWN